MVEWATHRGGGGGRFRSAVPPDDLFAYPRARLLTADGSTLLLIDLQERLVPAIEGGKEMVVNAARLGQAAALLDVPFWTRRRVRPDSTT